MKRWRVVISERADGQIFEQVRYIARDSVDNALGWEDRLRRAIQAILESGGRNAVDEAATARVGTTVHKLVFERTYLIHYLINAKERRIEIVGFRHGRRLPRRGEP